MLYSYKEAIDLFRNNYHLNKALLERRFFKIEKGIYSDGESNFTTIELILKKYNKAFLVKDSALHLIGFIEKEPDKIHLGTARNALRIKDDKVTQHFYSNLDVDILNKNEWNECKNFLSYQNIKTYTTENNNDIRLFDLTALFFDLIRNHKNYSKSTLYDLLEKFKNCCYFYGLTKWELEKSLQYENAISYLELLDDEIYEMIDDVFSEVSHRNFKIKYNLENW